MLSESELRANMRSWFSSVGLSGHPFAQREADADDNLPNYFVEVEYFDELMGDVENPRSFILFDRLAMPRSGKGRSRALYRASTTSLAYCTEDVAELKWCLMPDTERAEPKES